ncbi:MAG: hypothetical protein R3264_20525 [Anaerolineae bacterium]|nr:hypothetical protein [Anaerolineae bacterium]
MKSSENYITWAVKNYNPRNPKHRTSSARWNIFEIKQRAADWSQSHLVKAQPPERRPHPEAQRLIDLAG